MTRAAPSPLLVLLAASACSEPAAPPLPGPPDDVVRPTTVQSLDFDATRYSMPPGWDAGASWHVVVHDDGRILAGGASGTYRLGEPTELLDDAPVRGLLAHDELGFVIFSAEGIAVYDGELYPSALSEALADVSVLGVARRAEEVWLVTDAELFELEGESLFSYPGRVGIEGLWTHDDASLLIARAADGFTLLRDVGEGLSVQSLSDELEAIALASPGPHERVFAVTSDGGALVERVAVEGGVAWRSVALTSAAGDLGATGVDSIVADPVGGALWVARGESLTRIDGGGVVSAVGWPDGVAPSGRLVATADGAVWLTAGEQLVRVGPESPPPSYALVVVPFYQNNCARCHEPNGEVATVTRLSDYDAFAANIDDIITQVEQGLMPAGDQPLVGDPELPRKWRDGGMRP